MIGQTLQNRYRLDSELGRGGMGVVYRAHDMLLNRAIAVKLLSNSGLGTAGKVRLLAEARAAAKLNHPNIVAVHDAGEVDDNPFIVMELVAGESLRHFRPDSLDDTLNMTRQICRALEHAHRHGIIHRDLKPDNVVLTPDKTAKLMDFGLAHTAETPRLTEEDTLMGTFGYMAPELVLGQTASVQSDLYALGVMLYEWLVGQPPFTGENLMALMMQHLHEPVTPPGQHQPAIPAALDLLVMQLLSKEPEQRPSSATAVREVIDNVSGTSFKGGITFLSPALQQTRHNLPRLLTSFVGREKEIAHLQKQLLNPVNRLVTLTGPGGTGKTRLSIEASGTLLDAFADGIWLVELAPLTDPSLIVTTVAAVFGLREEGGRPLAVVLADYLQTRHLLLILDNCEHLVESCARLAQSWLESCPRLTILASSRETLSVPGEVAVQIPPLAVPDLHQLPSLDMLGQVEAVQLFVERARTARPDFTLTGRNGTAVAQVCQRLDGIPLAIELAAARVKVLPVEQVAQRLDDRFRLLTGGSRTALPRQQTLRATIDWSYDLLTEAEQILFSRLSVFVGGFTLEAAEVVCSQGMQPRDILDLLGRLVDKSLVFVEIGSESSRTRYHLLETIRQYACEKSLDANESEPLRDQHLRFFVQLAERSQRNLDTAQRTVWLPRMENEHDNLRAALEWACERDLETARWLAGNLERFWFFGDHLSEARTWYARVLNSGDWTTVSKGVALALLGSGIVSLMLEYLDEAQVSFEQSVVFWQKLGVQEWLATSLASLAYLLIQRGEHVQANDLYTRHEMLFRSSATSAWLIWVLSNWGSVKAAIRRDDPGAKALLDEALSLAQSVQDPFSILLCYSSLGDWAVLQEDYAAARRYFLEALELRRQLGTRWIIVVGLWQVANTMRLQGDYPQAEPMYAEALSSARVLGDQRSEAHIALELGAVAIHLGNVERATTLLAESLSSFRKWGDPLGIARCLMGFADLRLVYGHMEQAARVLSFVELWLRSNQIQLVHFDRNNYERSVTVPRTQLDEATFNQAWATGQSMTLDEAIVYALAE